MFLFQRASKCFSNLLELGMKLVWKLLYEKGNSLRRNLCLVYVLLYLRATLK